MIDAALRQRITPYFVSATVLTLQSVLDHLHMVNSELQEGEVWEPTDPRMQAIEASVTVTTLTGAIVGYLMSTGHALRPNRD